MNVRRNYELSQHKDSVLPLLMTVVWKSILPVIQLLSVPKAVAPNGLNETLTHTHGAHTSLAGPADR